MSDELREQPLYSTVEVGNLLRFLNSECVKFARKDDRESTARMADLSNAVEDALKLYEER